ncbi:MAG: acyl-CoA dehydrogenase family protein [Bacteriovoracales bacterium]|nr:acyl-CoA dehydrogenase family protein [Bacteriovoracales bacterium]
MDFDLNETQRELLKLAKKFAEEELAPHASTWDENHHFPIPTLEKAGECGLMGIYISEVHGGAGLSRVDASILLEELAKGCTSTAAYITIHNMCGWMIATFGSQEVCERYVGPMVAGKVLGSYCLTEPESGSDAASLKTKAIDKGDHFELSGSKMFISGGGSTGGVLIVMARTGDETPKGITAFVVDSSSEGIEWGKNEKKMGWNSQPTRALSLNKVKVPKDHILGKPGDGFKIAMKALDGGRVNIAACSLGAAQACLEQTHRYMNERSQFGKTLSQFQALQFRFADMATALVASRQMVRLAASKLDQNSSDKTVFCAMAKRFVTDECFHICDEAIQLHGGYGYTKEYSVERYQRDCRVHRILEGTNEIMRLIISRKILGEGALERIR